jgi:hypothetical protein
VTRNTAAALAAMHAGIIAGVAKTENPDRSRGARATQGSVVGLVGPAFQ